MQWDLVLIFAVSMICRIVQGSQFPHQTHPPRDPLALLQGCPVSLHRWPFSFMKPKAFECYESDFGVCLLLDELRVTMTCHHEHKMATRSQTENSRGEHTNTTLGQMQNELSVLGYDPTPTPKEIYHQFHHTGTGKGEHFSQ